MTDRVFTVGAESRRVTVPAEERRLVVGFEDRGPRAPIAPVEPGGGLPYTLPFTLAA